MSEELFLYRGTTPDWRGNECLKEQNITCTTTDPIVATLFAIECRSHGPGIILMAPMLQYEDLRGPDNHGSLVESAINILISPVEFARSAIIKLEVERAIEILARLNFGPLPQRLNGRVSLRIALEESRRDYQRLNLEQLRDFNRIALEVES